jgi:hypothetical protein
VEIKVPLKIFNFNNREVFTEEVKHLSYTATQKPKVSSLYEGIFVALQLILHEKTKYPSAHAMIILLSDGKNTMSFTDQRGLPLLETTDIPVHTMGFSPDEDLEKIARATNGVYVYLDENKNNDNLELRNFLKKVLKKEK